MSKKHFSTKATLAMIACLVSTGAVYAADVNEHVLSEYTVTASKYQLNELDTALDTVTVTHKELARTGADNVARALAAIPGIVVSSMGPDDQSWITGNTDVIVRGVPKGVLVLLNGVPVDFNGVSHLDAIPVSIVKRVEIIKGSGSILYGSSAYGGVVNVITKNKFDDTLSGTIGNHGKKKIEGALQADNVGFFATHSEMGSRVPGSVGSSGTKTINGKKIPYQFGFGDSKKDSYGFTTAITPELSAFYLHTKKKYSMEYVNQNDVNQALQHFDYDDREDHVQFNYNHKQVQAKAFYQKRSIRNPDYYTNHPEKLEWERSKQQVYGVDVSNQWNKNRATYTFGTMLKGETYSDTNQKFAQFGNSESALKNVATFGTYRLRDYALYGQARYDLTDKFLVEVSARQEFVNSDAASLHKFLPQGQLLYKLNDAETVYANVGKTFRMPTFRNLYYSSGALLANPDLKPEEGLNYEVGYKKMEKGNEWRVAAFGTNIKDQLASRRVNGRSQTYNAAEFKNAGLEASYTHKAKEGLYYRVGGIVYHPQQRKTATSNWENVVGRYQLSGSVGYATPKTDVSLSTIYYGGRYGAKASDKSPLWMTNLSVGQVFDANTTGRLTINNLFNRKDIANSDDNSTDFLVPEREISLTISHKF